jgi:hypothetical protein
MHSNGFVCIAQKWPNEVPEMCTNAHNASHTTTVPSLMTICENDIISPTAVTQTEPALRRAALQWTECQCAASGLTEVSWSRPLLASLLARTNNASSACFRRMDAGHLVGYLVKRYAYSGACVIS